VTGREVQRLTEIGILKAEGTERSRKYNLEESVRAYVIYLRDQPKQKRVEAGALENEKLQAEISIKKTKAKVAELEFSELEGSMHRSEDVEAAFTDLVFYVRSAFLAMPGRLAVDVADLKTPAEVSARIQEEVNEVLNTLSEYRYDPEEYKKRVKERQGWITADDETEE